MSLLLFGMGIVIVLALFANTAGQETKALPAPVVLSCDGLVAVAGQKVYMDLTAPRGEPVQTRLRITVSVPAQSMRKATLYEAHQDAVGTDAQQTLTFPLADAFPAPGLREDGTRVEWTLVAAMGANAVSYGIDAPKTLRYWPKGIAVPTAKACGACPSGALLRAGHGAWQCTDCRGALLEPAVAADVATRVGLDLHAAAAGDDAGGEAEPDRVGPCALCGHDLRAFTVDPARWARAHAEGALDGIPGAPGAVCPGCGALWCV